MKRTLILCILAAWPYDADAQAWTIRSSEYVGLRVASPALGGVPVILMGQNIWFSLDAIHAQPKDLRVEVVHHDRFWVRTASGFINDPSRISGRKPVSSTPAPAAIRSYRWSYGTSVPSGADVEPLRVSGNYVASIIDDETDEVVASFRFSVAERSLHTNLDVRPRRLPMKVAPWDEAHEVTMTVDEDVLQELDDLLFLQLVRVVDVYKNREWSSAYRIDMDALTASTWVDGLGTSAVSFTAGEVMPGNEYRSLDIRNVDRYPASGVLRSRDGADVSRFFSSTTPDHNGGSAIVKDRINADYERFEFQLWWEAENMKRPVYVLGDFNAWMPSSAWRLVPTGEEGRYALTVLLKRGRYDYQYALSGDPVPLEGNSWNTNNLYTAVTYYSDSRLGGYDRIVFVAQKEFGIRQGKDDRR